MSSNSLYQAVEADIDGRLPGIRFSSLVPPARTRLVFQVNAYDEMLAESLETLELTNRSINSLHRAGFRTIGDLLRTVRSSDELRRIRNCGEKSINEIMGKIFLYHYSLIPEERKGDYLRKVLAQNDIKGGA